MGIDKTFWKRLQSFIAKVQVNDAMSEEEREYILHVAAEQANKSTLFLHCCSKCGKKLDGISNHICSGGESGYRGESAHKLKYN
jgi:uncharacterized protein YmfQ (DUF2313 family)